MADTQHTSIAQWKTADLQVKLWMINFVIPDAGNNILDYLLHALICHSAQDAVDA